jgi:hypothetical protein
METLTQEHKIANQSLFNEEKVLHDLHHYLPSQNPLKDFVHHNSLHSFQEFPFHEAVRRANKIFGYKGYLQLKEYRELYAKGKITEEDLVWAITKNKGENNLLLWKEKMLNEKYDENSYQRIGELRNQWKSKMYINLDKEVFPILFRLISNYLDQGISIWHFPVVNKDFLTALRHIENTTKESLFRTEKARKLLFSKDLSITKLLNLLVGKEEYFARYLFDQQFSHPGWSGMVAVIERNPSLLYDKRKITLRDFIILELILELDVLYDKFHDMWSPLGYKAELKSADLFDEIENSELFEVYKLWLEAYEWNFYKQTLGGLKKSFNLIKQSNTGKKQKSKFQAFFCIDDREISIRRHIELLEDNCETLGTPGHFNIIAYYKPEKGKFLTKVCPAPLNPKHIIVEKHKNKKISEDTHFSKKTHSVLWGWILTQTLGFLSGLNLFKMLVKPSMSSGTNYSFDHMHADAQIEFEYKPGSKNNELQEGFTIEEMADIVTGILKTTGLTKDFAPLVYFIGHGASSTNNPYYAGYGCGACVGRPGSANARAAAAMANKPEVRQILKIRGVDIPKETQFVGGLHDTTRDEIAFYDENLLSEENKKRHRENVQIFKKALVNNAEERARRFDNIPLKLNKEKIYEKVKQRSVALFEIRPEYNHATNTLFIVGRRDLTKNLFLDRRSFLNSYDYRQDPTGELLGQILNAGAGVCAGINLEYYFSRVDNHRLGAGSKLPQNVVGLIGVANGVEGDLRTGLPYQMVEIHDPLRMLTIIEQYPDVVKSTLDKNPGSKQWFSNNWMNLVVLNPETGDFYLYDYLQDKFDLLHGDLPEVSETAPQDLFSLIKTTRDNLPVILINNAKN